MLIRETHKIQTKPGAYGFLAGALVLLLGLLANAGCAHYPRPAAVEVADEVSTTSASDVFAKQEAMIDFMRAAFPTVEADVRWRPCGQQNGFYYPSPTRLIVLCTEFEKDPDAAVFVAAHEFAHAITDQLLSTTDENDADEIAALAMIDAGYLSELAGAARWWQKHVVQNHRPGDEHPGAGYRAWELLCMTAGVESRGNYPDCKALYEGLSVKWYVRLNYWL